MHDLDVVHLDLKPGNLLFKNVNGFPKFSFDILRNCGVFPKVAYKIFYLFVGH